MRGFLVGLVVGLLAGGGGVYLAVKKPWAGEETANAAPDAGVAVAKKKKKRRRGKRRRGKGTRETYRVDGPPPELSAADRKLVWRGGAVRLPKRSMDFAGGDDARSLTSSEINSVIRSSSGGVLACIRKSRGAAELSATITVKMLVDGSGSVKKVALRAPSYLFAHGFAACATSAARGMRFPGVGGHTVVTAPYTLD